MPAGMDFSGVRTGALPFPVAAHARGERHPQITPTSGNKTSDPAHRVINTQNDHIWTASVVTGRQTISAYDGGYRVPPTRRAVTVGNEAPPAGVASKVPDASDPSTLAWPSRSPAALRRRHWHPAAERSWSCSFAPGDTFLTGTSPASSARLKVLH